MLESKRCLYIDSIDIFDTQNDEIVDVVSVEPNFSFGSFSELKHEQSNHSKRESLQSTAVTPERGHDNRRSFYSRPTSRRNNISPTGYYQDVTP